MVTRRMRCGSGNVELGAIGEMHREPRPSSTEVVEEQTLLMSLSMQLEAVRAVDESVAPMRVTAERVWPI